MLIVWLRLNISGFRPVLARGWHGYPLEPMIPSVRELRQAPMLLYLGADLLRVVRMRPLMSVVVSGDRYTFGYSVAPLGDSASGHEASDPSPRLCRGTRRDPGTL